ncbi:MAG: DUF4129 domain-containing protein [Verrucomicrobiaceae bacterium]|nr:DUF4129 domain-containing protein [Verrucomicrobiaceae bacterium]
MKLEDITVALRPRDPWEAVDLGCSMARRDFGALMALWGATVLPVWIVLALVLRGMPAWFLLVVWWLKPLYDRVPLFFLSRAAFGVRPGFRETWKAWPRLWSKDLFSALLLRRLSLMRSFALPVIMLEGQKGKAMRRRIDALATDGGGSGTSVTWVFLKLETAAWLGLLFFTANFIPDSIAPDWWSLVETGDVTGFTISPEIYWWINGCYLAAVTLVEPFYVGAGFGVYLNCRTRLEGWDVELAFRRMASRVSALAATAAAVLALVVPLGAVASSLPRLPEVHDLPSHHPLSISSTGGPAASPKKPSAREKVFSEAARSKPARRAESGVSPKTRAANEMADEILKRPDFTVHSRKFTRWVWDSHFDSESSLDLELLRVIAYVFVWAALAAAVIALVVYLMRNRHLLGLPQLAARPMERSGGPRVVMGMDIGRDSLPEDIIAAARELWRTHGPREALSLLYRGTLSRLVERHRLPIRDSDTEDDCLAHVRATGARDVAGYFSRLTHAWVCQAYAGLAASDAEFDQLCGTWPFQSAAAPARSTAPALAVMLALMVPFIASCSGHWVEDDETLGYKGKARVDPFLAAETLLGEYGHDAERTPTLGKMPASETGVIFTSSEAGVPEGRAKQLLSWAGRGGHLVYCMAGGMPYNDFSKSGGFTINFGTDERPDPILTKLGVKLHDRRPKLDVHAIKTTVTKSKKQPGQNKPAPADTPDESGQSDKNKDDSKTKPEKKAAPSGDTTTVTSTRWGAQTYALELSDKITFTPARSLRPGEWFAGEEKSPFIMSLHFGSGRVTLLNHARPLRNKHLGDHDHAGWLVALVDDGSGVTKNVRFVVGMSASFWTLLRQRAWMPLVGVALAVIVWLWKSGRRFGPVMPLELSETKHFADHVSALGQFYFRLRRGDVLLKAAAEAVRSRFRRKFPQLASADDDGATMIARLAEKSGLSKERVAAALATRAPGQNHQLVRLLQDLQSLRQSL